MNRDEEKLQQSTWKLWGEERTENAVYRVYLKKVKYHSSPNLSDSQSEISHLEWETTCVKFIKAGTLEKLIDCLTSENGELEPTYINIFFATYRTFATVEQVLRLVLERYERLVNNDSNLPEAITKQREKSIVIAIQIWLDSYPDDFNDPPLHIPLQRLILFSRHYLPNSDLLLKSEHRLQHRVKSSTSMRHDFGRFNSGDRHLDVINGPSFVSTGGIDAGPRTSNAIAGVYGNFVEIPCKHFAEQLTRIDTELFKRLVPHQCLGAVWSRRDKSRTNDAATVLATVNQFNAVSFCVISTILVDANLKTTERAKIISAWINIAQELRLLKNFSSLKAIISSLQSNPIYRLRKTWQAVPKEKVEIFVELARIFSEENNQLTQRELLMREGTAKFADTISENDKHLPKIIHHQLSNCGKTISHGTIPYLGTFLTDLTMINTAIPDILMDGLVNFDKKCKEFEVLAKIKLLQGAANSYHIKPDPAFDRWFDSVLILDDKEAYRLSCLIEPLDIGHQSELFLDTNSSQSNLSSPRNNRKSQKTPSSDSNNNNGFLPMSTYDRKSPTVTLNDTSASSYSSDSSNNNNGSTSPYQSNTFPSDYYIIRVALGIDLLDTLTGTILYKSIVVGSNDRTQQVIRNAMVKLGIKGDSDDYELAQVLPDREMVLPPNANVYYAVNTAYNLNFVLRAKNPSHPDGANHCAAANHAMSNHANTPNKCKFKTSIFPS